jgi:hypothetical protein
MGEVCMTLAAGRNHWTLPGARVTLVGWVLSFAGCAAGAWLESPSEADLPLDPPARGYPTAVRASLSDSEASQPAAAIPAAMQSSQPAVAPASMPAQPAPSDAAHSIAAQSPAQPPPRPDRQPLQPPLAVIPPQFVHHPVNPTPAQASTPAASLHPVTTETAPVAAALPSQWPTLPQVDTSFPSPATSWQPPAALPAAALPAAMSVDASAAVPIASVVASPETKASYDRTDSPADGRAQREHAQGELIESLEAEIRQRRAASGSDEELPRLEQQLRLVYLAAGRLDEAVAGVESLDPQQREAFKHLMFGMGVWLSPDESRRAPLRSAKVLHSLREANGELAAASKLELRNLVFCERVDHFGWYTEFPRREFQPKQQVILYTEVENCTAEHKAPGGYETELQGSYEILDSSGQIVASRQLQLDKEVCRNYRRDYFLAYRVYMPDAIAPGHYRLELTVEDLKARGKYQGRKLGEGMIEFTIR